jgi:hypothetical protein
MSAYGKKTTDAHWEEVWERLRERGVVEVHQPPAIPYCPSSCLALADYIRNPGATRNVRVRLQSQSGESTFSRGDWR